MKFPQKLVNAFTAIRKFMTTQQQLDEAMIAAVRAGDVEKMQKAAANGGNPSAQLRSWEDASLLTLAVDANNGPMVTALLALKADVNAKIGYGGKTALGEAVRHNRTAIATELVAAGADLNAPDRDGRTPYTLAVANRNAKLATLFASRDAKLDAADKYGWTALAYAVRNGDGDTVSFLLAKGARTDGRDRDGRTLLDIARQYDRPAVERQLNDHYDSLVPAWQKTADTDEVAHVSFLRDAGYKLTEVFNMRTKRLTAITHNFDTGRDATETRGFTDADKKAVAEAQAKLDTLRPKPLAQGA